METGLYHKYIVTKTSGKPLADGAEFIVLRIDGGQYVGACRKGVAAFAQAVQPDNTTLATDLFARLKAYELRDIADDISKATGG